MFLFLSTICDTLFYILYSLIITSLIIGSLILFSLTIFDNNLLNPIKYVLGNGIRRAGKVLGQTILYGSGIVTGADAALNIRQKYLDQQKNNPNNNNSGSSNNPNSNSNNTSNSKPNNSTPTVTKTPVSNPTPTSNPTPSSAPSKGSLLLWALSYLDINVSENSSDMFNLLSSILTLELIALFGFINIIIYFICYILYLKYDIESKISSPRIKKNNKILCQILHIFYNILNNLTLISNSKYN